MRLQCWSIYEILLKLNFFFYIKILTFFHNSVDYLVHKLACTSTSLVTTSLIDKIHMLPWYMQLFSTFSQSSYPAISHCLHPTHQEGHLRILLHPRILPHCFRIWQTFSQICTLHIPFPLLGMVFNPCLSRKLIFER